MSIILTPDQEQLLQRLVSTGRYSSPTEALEVALALLEEQDHHYEEWLKETRQKIQVGIAELDRGEGIDGEGVIERLQAKLLQARNQTQ